MVWKTLKMSMNRHKWSKMVKFATQKTLKMVGNRINALEIRPKIVEHSQNSMENRRKFGQQAVNNLGWIYLNSNQKLSLNRPQVIWYCSPTPNKLAAIHTGQTLFAAYANAKYCFINIINFYKHIYIYRIVSIESISTTIARVLTRTQWHFQ